LPLDIEPGIATFHYNYALLILHLGDVEMARKHLEEVLSIIPAYEGARPALDNYRVRLKNRLMME